MTPDLSLCVPVTDEPRRGDFWLLGDGNTQTWRPGDRGAPAGKWHPKADVLMRPPSPYGDPADYATPEMVAARDAAESLCCDPECRLIVAPFEKTTTELPMKTITMSALRAEPGERVRDVQRGGESFLITKAGKPAAKLVPTEDGITVERDGTVRGEPEPGFLRAVAALRGAGGY